MQRRQKTTMFKDILIPISSEFYSKRVLRRGVFLAEKYQSKLYLLYIIEEKTLSQTDKVIKSYRTSSEIEETKKELINFQRRKADSIIFEDAKELLQNKKIPFEEKIIEGEFSEVVEKELDKNQYDLILMGFEKECLLHYRLLESVGIPIWVEGEGDNNKILAVCSNLAPNKKVPDMSVNLSETLGWELQMLYVVDIEDNVQVDEQGRRSNKKSEKDLLLKGQQFIEEMKDKKIPTRLVKGSLERETIVAAEDIDANLIIVGREQKKKGLLGIPVKNLKRKIAEKCKYSILFIN